MKKYYDLYFHDSGGPLTYNPFLPPPKKPEKPRDYFTLAFWCLMILGVMGVCYGSYEVGREVGKKEEKEPNDPRGTYQPYFNHSARMFNINADLARQNIGNKKEFNYYFQECKRWQDSTTFYYDLMYNSKKP